MPIKVGTSGYAYFWNEGKPTPFEWYLKQGFNSVEINASFYRFPAKTWLKAWEKAPRDFTFSIKVHRSITHYAKLKGRAFELWNRFRQSLRQIEDRIQFWLFQMPPRYGCKELNLETMRSFFEEARLGNKAVVEFRDPSWWKVIMRVEETGVVFCSVDAPGLPRDIVATNKAVYLRLHGREEWYSHVYSKEELDHIMLQMKKLKAEKKAIYLNNDHGMLENGLYLLRHT